MESCATDCPTTCKNRNGPPLACAAVCFSGCVCDKGPLVARSKNRNGTKLGMETDNDMETSYVTYGKQFQDTGFIERKSGKGRPSATTAREDRHLLIIARHNRGATASQLSHYLYAVTGTRVSRLIVSKRLYEKGLFTRRPDVCVLRNDEKERVRLSWCRQPKDWNRDQWATVLFTDESHFSLNIDSRHAFIWREPGICFLPSNVHEIDNYGE
ncbi:transposable element Tc1 transposase [Trichonephila clavipes]|nr:transposable element Tc1 transposase [Trichonephila clavipes]